MSNSICEQCDIPNGGFCKRHDCEKTAHWVELCRMRPEYFRQWEEGNGPGQSGLASLDTTASKKGPGTELQKIILAWQNRFPFLKMGKAPGCSCAAIVNWMNRVGPNQCECAIEKIVDAMAKEAGKRELPIPFKRFWAARMVKKAIRLSRRYITETAERCDYRAACPTSPGKR